MTVAETKAAEVAVTAYPPTPTQSLQELRPKKQPSQEPKQKEKEREQPRKQQQTEQEQQNEQPPSSFGSPTLSMTAGEASPQREDPDRLLGVSRDDAALDVSSDSFADGTDDDDS